MGGRQAESCLLEAPAGANMCLTQCLRHSLRHRCLSQAALHLQGGLCVAGSQQPLCVSTEAEPPT